jgi:hypothetical protein
MKIIVFMASDVDETKVDPPGWQRKLIGVGRNSGIGFYKKEKPMRGWFNIMTGEPCFPPIHPGLIFGLFAKVGRGIVEFQFIPDNFVTSVVIKRDVDSCIRMMREGGYDAFAADMAASGRQTIKRN